MMGRNGVWVAGILALIFSGVYPGEGIAYNEGSRIHFEADFEVLERDITQEDVQFLGQNFPEETTSFESLRLLGKLSVQVIDPLEIYGLFGGSDLEVSDFGFSADFGAAYGGGARLILYREESREMFYHLFADYRFLTFKANDTVRFAPQVDLNGNGIIEPGEILTDERLKERIRWAEHVIKFGVMGRQEEFEPYGGIRFSFVRGKDHLPSQAQELNIKLKQSDIFGLFLGTNYYLSRSERAALFIEGSLFDQFSLTGGVRVGF